MKVGWLCDSIDYFGGAELTQAEFRAAAPEGVEVIDCPPGGVMPDLDRYVIHNCVKYTLHDLEHVTARKVVKYHHDVGPWLKPDVRAWLSRRTLAVCCSPVQADYMGISASLIPPPIDLDRFSQAAESVNGDRAGAVCVGSWRNYTKAPYKVAEWGARNGESIDYYGGGACAPPGSVEVAYDQMPELLAQYRTFVFLPAVLEPFGRVVAEAWAAGCEVVTNRLVGARYWITEKPEAIETAAADFWELLA